MNTNNAFYYSKGQENQIYKDLDYLDTKSTSENKELLKVINDPDEVAKCIHGLAILKEWDEFNDLDWKRIKESMKESVFIFDRPKLLDKQKL